MRSKLINWRVVKHPYEQLYTYEERKILAWPEQPLPVCLPAAVLEHAVAGAQLHDFFEGKQVWFIRRPGLEALLDFTEKEATAAQKALLYVALYDVYFEQEGRYEFGANYCMGAANYGYDLTTHFREFLLGRNGPEFRTALYWFYFWDKEAIDREDRENDPRLQEKVRQQSRFGCGLILLVAILVLGLLVWLLRGF
jgi:hypothetical protein